MKFVTMSILGILFSAHAFGAAVCDDPTRNTAICEKMYHLRSQIFALDAQRELMQVNPDYMKAIGRSLSVTAKDILRRIGPGLPEHHQALSGVVRSGENLSDLAAKADPQMLVQANTIRMNCATCHNSRLSGNPSWEDVFGNDWAKISVQCVMEGKNPYLCKSMNGMLSAYGYLYTGFRTDIQDFTMTAEAADEIVRILEDLKRKNFYHLPEELRSAALQLARETSSLARARNTAAFEKGYSIMNTCTKCHDEKFGPVDPGEPRIRGSRADDRDSLLPLAFVRSTP